jgi:hypothetical protein
MTHIKNKNQLIFIISAVLTMLLIYCLSPITQSIQYHQFADQRYVSNLPHIGDFISNFAFVIAGIALLIYIKKLKKENYGYCGLYFSQKVSFYSLAISSILLGLGSGYYHYAPDNATLAWDRAAMVLGFAVIYYDSLVRYQIISTEHVCTRLFIIMLLFVSTVVYWSMIGGLEPYVFVQFFTMFVLVVLALCNYKHTPSKHLFLMFTWYLVAKICETFDKQIFIITNYVISGHTLKHLAYAIALYVFGRYMLECKNNQKIKICTIQ